MTDDRKARRFFVSGRVQGVGFRYFAQHAAEHLHLHGYVRNLPDGRVEAYAIGDPGALAKFHAALEKGPWTARVGEVTCADASVDLQYADGFHIL